MSSVKSNIFFLIILFFPFPFPFAGIIYFIANYIAIYFFKIFLIERKKDKKYIFKRFALELEY
ncbi:hypothetical protein BGA29 (plasmid) [Borreliella bavariensis PBi]|uniref:Uncharacterized protein n=1 Tax=Borrelia garinii subsp. bavariensis (strain ATCC BAA-2496 / DSM 23469 / PBi) TaxID=290434 RepID=A0A7I6GV84_BORGP|nr:hypothetical protein BGA29 [Borreliella bavariensis PBi]AZA27160.1 hypothetical protein DB299_04490 [Borreliella bavariensis PBi]